MASGWTDKGVFSMFDEFFRTTGAPTNMFVALVTSATAPLKTHNTLSELTEITAGNGYTAGGFSLTRNSTDFDVLTEADPVILQIKDVVWTASGGPIPLSGGDARWAVLLDDNVTVGSREIYAWFDLVSDRSVSSGQTLTLVDCELQGDMP